MKLPLDNRFSLCYYPNIKQNKGDWKMEILDFLDGFSTRTLWLVYEALVGDWYKEENTGKRKELDLLILGVSDILYQTYQK